MEHARITVINYSDTQFEENRAATLDDCAALARSPEMTWVNVDGVQDVDLVQKLGEYAGLHPLVVEDIVHTAQRPKLEDFGDYLYMVVRMLRREQNGDLVSEQVSLILGRSFVLSFQEQPGDVFESIRNRLRDHKGRIRKLGPDYLAYALLDAVVDHYFVVLEPFGDRAEELQEELTSSPGNRTVRTIHGLKRELVHLRKSVWPLREVISGLERIESSLVKKSTSVYLRDLHDHTVQVIDVIEAFRDTLSGMLDIYLSVVSNRMNEVMKVLTIIATIFIPLTFIAGIYGMNFKFMPELEWHWGYFLVLGAMLAITVGMVAFFKRKRWL